ncbi:hypothetical protein ColKHC_06150 [Colletotrichum higginsianum]|nr:hypothetical protein ColKHC_06150 [Colletotrichum higginsianum]
MFGTAMIPAPGPIYDEQDLADLAEDFRRSKESLKAAGRRLTSRQTSRATRASRASIESRGPLSSNEDLDLHAYWQMNRLSRRLRLDLPDIRLGTRLGRRSAAQRIDPNGRQNELLEFNRPNGDEGSVPGFDES